MLSTTTPLQIKNNPSNTSTSKHQWSFSKSSRFKSPRSSCNQSFYDSRSCLSERKTSFGYGSRNKFFDGRNDVPEGGKYNLKTDIEKNKKQTKGHNFTANRQNLKFADYTKTGEITPDPLTYDIDSNQVKVKRAYSLRPKTAYPRNYFLPNQNQETEKSSKPGPGKYETIDVLGARYMTKSRNNQGKSFMKNNRFSKEKTTPGPLQYKNNTIQADGIYFLSNMKSQGKRTFMQGRRNFKLDNTSQTPPPGSYRLNSDFGHYENKTSLPSSPPKIMQ